MSRHELAVDLFGWHALWASEDVVPTAVSLSGTVRSTNVSHTESITVPDPVSGFVECGRRVVRRERVWRNIGLTIGLSLISVLPALLIGSVGISIGRRVYVFVKRGYETAVFGHTLSDWIAFLLFSGG